MNRPQEEQQRALLVDRRWTDEEIERFAERWRELCADEPRARILPLLEPNPSLNREVPCP